MAEGQIEEIFNNEEEKEFARRADAAADRADKASDRAHEALLKAKHREDVHMAWSLADVAAENASSAASHGDFGVAEAEAEAAERAADEAERLVN